MAAIVSDEQRGRYVGVRLPRELLEQVDAEARRLGEGRSLAIRSLLRRALAESAREQRAAEAA